MLVSQAYVLGGLSFGGLVAGVCANAGLGFLILFKNTKKLGRTLAVLAVMYIVGVAVGYAALGCIQLFGL